MCLTKRNPPGSRNTFKAQSLFSRKNVNGISVPNDGSLKGLVQSLFNDKRAQKGAERMLYFIESTLSFIWYVKRATTSVEYFMACQVYLRAITGQSVIAQSSLYFRYLSHVFEGEEIKFGEDVGDLEDVQFEPQSSRNFMDNWNNLNKAMGKIIESADSVVSADVVTKTKRFIIHCLCLNILGDKFSFESLGYDEIEATMIKRSQTLSPASFAFELLKMAHLLLTKGYTLIHTGDWNTLFIDEEEFIKFHEIYLFLKTHELHFHGGDEDKVKPEEYLKALSHGIAMGKSLYKVLHQTKRKNEFSKVFQMLVHMQTIESKIFTSDKTRKHRAPPLGILLHGTPGVGKSTLTELLFIQYAGLVGIVDENNPFKPDDIYTRNANANFWDGFKTYQWGLVLDDIGFMNPRIASNGDPTVMELLQIINTVPFVPDQASIEDKGNTPFCGRIVIGTTNTKSLNASCYFSEPAAVMRRFPMIVTATVKKEYATKDGRLDSSKVGDNIHLWNLKVEQYEIQTPGSTKPITLQEGKKKNKPSDDHGRYTTVFEGPVEKWLRDGDDSNKNTFNAMALRFLADNKTQRINSEAMRCRTMCKHHSIMCDDPECVQLRMDKARLTVLEEEEAQDIKLTRWEKMYEKVKNFDVQEYFFPSLTDDELQNVCDIGNDAKVILEPQGNPFTEIANRFQQRFDEWDLKNMRRQRREYVAKRLNRKKNKMLSYFKTKKDTLGDLTPKEIRKMINSHKPKIPVDLGYLLLGAGMIALLIKNWTIIKGIFRLGPQSERTIDLKRVEADAKGNIWEASPQYTFPDNPFQLEQQSLHRNVAKIVVSDKEEIIDGELSVVQNTSYATNIGGSLWLAPAHMFTDRAHEVDFIISVDNGVNKNCFNVLVSDCDMVFDRTRDIVMINALDCFRGRNIRNLFIEKFVDLKSKVEIISNDEGKKVSKNGFVMRKSDLLYNPDGSGDLQFEGYLYELKTQTEKGLCGSLVVAKLDQISISNRPFEKAKILGIHIAGSGYQGCCFPMTQSLIAEMEAKLGKRPIAAPGPVQQPGYEVFEAQFSATHRNACTNWIKGSATIYGSINLPRVSRRSRVRRTLIAKDVESLLQVKQTHFPPDMKSYRPFRHAVNDLTNPVLGLDKNRLERCKEALLDSIIEGLEKSDPEGKLTSQVGKLDLKTNINGAPGIRFVDKIKRNTSAGFPYKGNKKGYSKPIAPYGETLDPIDFTDEIHSMYNTYKKIGKTGQRFGTLFTAHLKDEPRPKKKVEQGKTRVFTGANLPFTLLEREYFLSITRVLQNHWHVWESAVGVNCYSEEWKDFYRYIIRHGKDKIICGDFKAFDKRMPPSIIMESFDILIKLNLHFGDFSKEDEKLMRVISTEVAYPLVNVDGTVIEFVGGNPSGHSLTVVINSIANSLYMRYVFDVLCERHNKSFNVKDFKRFVHLLTYGDDNIMGVSEEVPWFNHTNIQEVFAEVGITYTMADKDAESVPFINIEQADFLKRSFKEIHGKVVAPLALESIYKSLIVHVDEGNITQEAHAEEVIVNSLRELSLHGAEVYNRHQNLLQQIVDKYNLNVIRESWKDVFEAVTGSSKMEPQGHRRSVWKKNNPKKKKEFTKDMKKSKHPRKIAKRRKVERKLSIRNDVCKLKRIGFSNQGAQDFLNFLSRHKFFSTKRGKNRKWKFFHALKASLYPFYEDSVCYLPDPCYSWNNNGECAMVRTNSELHWVFFQMSLIFVFLTLITEEGLLSTIHYLVPHGHIVRFLFGIYEYYLTMPLHGQIRIAPMLMHFCCGLVGPVAAFCIHLGYNFTVVYLAQWDQTESDRVMKLLLMLE